MQAFMYFTKLETGRELLVITMFHFLGMVMEVYKIAMGSWYYPEFAYTKMLGVPLYSGFMRLSIDPDGYRHFVCMAGFAGLYRGYC
jgi:uncharacterized membrane protein YoaT (DUF817 family)